MIDVITRSATIQARSLHMLNVLKHALYAGQVNFAEFSEYPVIQSATIITQGLEMLRQERPDIVFFCPDILDAKTSKWTISSFIKKFRGLSEVPLVVFTQEYNEEEKAASSGADGYLLLGTQDNLTYLVGYIEIADSAREETKNLLAQWESLEQSYQESWTIDPSWADFPSMEETLSTILGKLQQTPLPSYQRANESLEQTTRRLARKYGSDKVLESARQVAQEMNGETAEIPHGAIRHADACRKFKISDSLLSTWIKRGQVTVVKRLGRGQVFVNESDVETMATRRVGRARNMLEQAKKIVAEAEADFIPSA